MKKIYAILFFLLVGKITFAQFLTYESSDTSSLEINNVRATIFNSADKWWDLSSSNPIASYEIPKGSGKKSLFAGSLWIGGLDSSGNLCVAAQTYRQGGTNDFFPGPARKNNCVVSADTANCVTYDHVWNFNKAEILNFINTGVATPDILSYPANGNTSMGELPVLAPYFDNNGDGIYDPAQGDYPLMDVYNNLPDSIDYLHGEQCLYSIYNDVAWNKTETGSPTMNLEVHSQSYAFPSSFDAINNTTFYEYKIINRSCQDYNNVYVAHWVDPDLGDYVDDYVGSDLPSNMGFCYNGDNDDGTGIPEGYAANPPAIGVKVLKAPLAPPFDAIDNNHDGVIDEVNEEWGMRTFFTYDNINNSPYGNPTMQDDYYNYMRGLWKDSSSLLCPSSNLPTTYAFPGTSNPDCPANWTEASAGNAPGDRRFLVGTGPLTLAVGAEVTIVYGVIWSRGISNVASLDSLIVDADVVENFYRNGFTTSVTELQPSKPLAKVHFYPNPSKGVAKLVIPDAVGNETFTLTLGDVTGKPVYANRNVTNRFELNTETFNTGVYFYRVTDSKGISFNGKLIVN